MKDGKYREGKSKRNGFSSLCPSSVRYARHNLLLLLNLTKRVEEALARFISSAQDGVPRGQPLRPKDVVTHEAIIGVVPS